MRIITMKPIRLILSEPSEKHTVGASLFWGNPDLPEGEAYPMYIDADGDEFPYCFICQINLEHLAAFAPENPLPHSGLLSFFAKIDYYLGDFDAPVEIGGTVCDKDAVKVLYFPDIDNLREVVLVDDEDEEINPRGLDIRFTYKPEPYTDEHELFARPTHREWKTWDPPYEDRMILLQIDSFEGEDFELNFMDCGVLDFLISPKALAHRDFSDVRAIVLST